MAVALAERLLGGSTAVVLAGGQGRRIRSLYPDVPKPLIPIGERPFLHWVTGWLVAQGISDIVFSTGHLGDQVERWSATLSAEGLRRVVCRQERAALGTGGGLLNVLDLCNDPILVTNGDTLFLAQLAPAFARCAEERLDGVLMGTVVDKGERFGALEIDEAGCLAGFGETRSGSGIVNAGTYLFRRSILSDFPKAVALSLEHDIIPALLEREARLGVVIARAPFLDIGVPDSLKQAESFVSRHCVGAAEFLTLH